MNSREMKTGQIKKKAAGNFKEIKFKLLQKNLLLLMNKIKQMLNKYLMSKILSKCHKKYHLNTL